MADWSALVEGFQKGSDWRQRFRANKQSETARDQALEQGEYGLQSARDMRRTSNPDAASVLGPDYAAGNTDWGGQLQDPFAYKLLDWIKAKLGKKKGKALDTGEGSITPTDATSVQALAEEEPLGPDFADGGSIPEYKDRSKPSKDAVARGTDRTAKLPTEVKKPGLVRRAINSGAGKLGAAAALGATAVDTAQTDTEDYRKRFGLETDDPSLLGDMGVRALGAASDLGNALTFGAAGKLYRDKQEQAGALPAPAAAPADAAPAQPPARAALPGAATATVSSTTQRGVPSAPAAPAPEILDFSDLDVDAKEVPDMKTDDWRQYRAQMIAAAQKSGNPDAVAKANDLVTHMQQQGFVNYGQQGLMLQQAGNIRGAMAAYRAAFQYFPNGHDVEFGTHVDKKSGHQQIVGFGVDEQTKKVVPGTELVMDPERVAMLLENFKNPQAFRMWTKDWRDFQQGQRKYEEVEKPLAQAQADALATNSDANVLRAENAALRAGAGGGAGGAGMRNSERVFRERLQMMGLEDATQADYLASIMSQVKAQNPQIPDNTIVQVIMQSASDGTLQQRLKRMGIQ